MLARMRLDDLEILVDRGHMIGSLRSLGQLRRVVISGSFASSRLDSDLPRHTLDHVTVQDNPLLSDLPFLRRRPGIRHLFIGSEADLVDISALAGSSLATLELDASSLRPGDLDVIPDLDDLRELRLWGLPAGRYAQLPPPHPTLARLSVSSPDLQLESLHRWTGLRGLAVWQATHLGELFAQVATLPRLRALQLPMRDPATELAGLPALPGIHSLTLPHLRNDPSLEGLGLAFPFLRRLTLFGDWVHAPEVDLTPLHGLPGVSVTFASQGQPLVHGSAPFAGRLHFPPPPSASAVRVRGGGARSVVPGAVVTTHP